MCGGRNERKPNVSTVKARPAGAGRGLPVVSAGGGHMKQDESVRRAACILHCYVIITEAIFVIKRVMFEWHSDAGSHAFWTPSIGRSIYYSLTACSANKMSAGMFSPAVDAAVDAAVDTAVKKMRTASVTMSGIHKIANFKLGKDAWGHPAYADEQY
jgi:hypothetical protein